MKWILSIIILIFVWMFCIEPSMLVVNTYDFPFPELAGQKAVIASDFHFRSEKQVERAANKLNGLNADYIFYLGDYTETVPPEYVEKKLSSVKAKNGIYSITGNHDEDSKINLNLPHLLNNTFIDSGKIRIAGVTYFNPDLYKAVPDLKKPVILLAHNPDIYKKVPKEVRLILSGHTHGGQVTLFGRPFITPSKYRFSRGFYITSKDNPQPSSKSVVQGQSNSYAPANLFITSGIGTTGLPARLFCPGEIVVINFTK